MSERTEEEKAILNKVDKLLRLAASNPNEQEAAAATAKAQDLLAAYNLDMAALAENTGGGARMRDDLAGGRYEWQQDLWGAVAHLNFCTYVNQRVFVKDDKSSTEQYRKVETEEGSGNYVWRKVRGRWQHQHRIVGRKVNVIATKAMATYLEGVCDRIVKERVKNTNERANGRWANSFRAGLTNRIVIKIYKRREELLTEEERKRMEALEAAAARTNGMTSSATALTLSSYADSEWDANIDFAYGEGTSAKWAAERAAQAEAERKADEEYTRWALANPEKARKQEEDRRRKEEERRARSNNAYFKGKDSGAWSEGHRAGEDVSIDPQAEQRKAAGLLR